MADLHTAIANGDWKLDEATAWDLGAAPHGGDSVSIAGFHVDVTTTTNAITTLDPTSGGFLHIMGTGTLNHSGIITLDSNETLRCEAGATITYTGADAGGAWVRVKTGAIIQIAGTAANMVTIQGQDATHRSSYLIWVAGYPSLDSFIQGLYLHNASSQGYVGSVLAQPIVNLHIEDCAIGLTIDGSSAYSGLGTVRNLGIHGCSSGVYVRGASVVFENALFGETLAGVADANTAADIYIEEGRVLGQNVRLASATPLTLLRPVCDFACNNYGYTAASGIVPERGTIGVSRTDRGAGTVQSSGATQVMTPSASCGANAPLTLGELALSPFAADIPCAGGDILSLSASVTLNASQPANSVTLVLDPANLYGAYAASVEATPSNATTTITASGTVKSGSYNARVPWELRVNNYGAGGTVTLNSVTVNGKTFQVAPWTWASGVAAPIHGGLIVR